jgi:hypothetical protein
MSAGASLIAKTAIVSGSHRPTRGYEVTPIPAV